MHQLEHISVGIIDHVVVGVEVLDRDQVDQVIVLLPALDHRVLSLALHVVQLELVDLIDLHQVVLPDVQQLRG